MGPRGQHERGRQCRVPVPRVFPLVKGKGHAGGDQIRDFLSRIGKENTAAFGLSEGSQFATPEKGSPPAGLPARGRPSGALFLQYEWAASYNNPWSRAQARSLKLRGHPAGSSL